MRFLSTVIDHVFGIAVWLCLGVGVTLLAQGLCPPDYAFDPATIRHKNTARALNDMIPTRDQAFRDKDAPLPVRTN